MKLETIFAMAITGAMITVFVLDRMTCRSELHVKPGQSYVGGMVTVVTLRIDGSQEAIVWMPDGDLKQFGAVSGGIDADSGFSKTTLIRFGGVFQEVPG